MRFTKLHPRFEALPSTEQIDFNQVDINNKSGPYSKKNPFVAKVLENKRMTSEDHFQDTILLVLDTTNGDESLNYKPGDVVMVQPKNIPQDVQLFIDSMSFDGESRWEFQSTNDEDALNGVIPDGVTVRQLATHYLDFKAMPGRSFFQTFALFSNDENEAYKLRELGSMEGTDDRYEYVNRPRRNILEVMQDFHKTTANIKVNNLLDLFPIMRARPFSIASSPSVHKNQIHILVAVVDYKTKKLVARRTGLCSTYMKHLRHNDDVMMWVKGGGIRFHDDRPNIMVGPGTGIAPIRSCVHEMVHRNKNDSVVFFGCRNKDKDFYFEEEWKQLSEGVELFTAFSRDQSDKVYVQHLIKQQAQLLWDFIENKNASIYVVGSSNQMPSNVKEAFTNVYVTEGGMNQDEAENYQKQLEVSKRYQQETWA